MDLSSNPIISEECLQSRSDIDQMTLSLLMNKQSYNKIFSKQDPGKNHELKEYREKVEKFRHQIIEITKDKLGDPELQITNTIDDVFEGYVKAIIQHLEQKETEQANKFNTFSQDEDTMFGNVIDEPSPTLNKSYWGKHTVVKQGYLKNNFFEKSTKK